MCSVVDKPGLIEVAAEWLRLFFSQKSTFVMAGMSLSIFVGRKKEKKRVGECKANTGTLVRKEVLRIKIIKFSHFCIQRFHPQL